MKAILNSVVYDPTLSVPWQLRLKDYNPEFLKIIDLGRGVEVLEWFSIASIKMDNDDLEQTYEDAKRIDEDDHKRFIDPNLLSLSSLLERVMINDLTVQSTENKQLLENNQFIDYERIRTL